MVASRIGCKLTGFYIVIGADKETCHSVTMNPVVGSYDLAFIHSFTDILLCRKETADIRVLHYMLIFVH